MVVSTYPAITIEVSERKGWLCARFKFHPGLVAIFKQLPQRSWNDPDQKAWAFYPSTVAIKAIEGTGAHVSITKAAKDLWQQRGGTLKQPPLEDNDPLDVQEALTPDVKTLAPKLPLPIALKFVSLPMVHQLECLQCIYSEKKFYLNMDTGTGKTWLYLNTAKLACIEAGRPLVALLVGPKNKIPEYEDELKEHFGAGGIYVDGRGSVSKWEKALRLARQFLQRATQEKRQPYVVFVCLNWESLHALTKDLPPDFFDLYLEDESHNGKNPTSQRGRAAYRLAKYTPWVLRGSATPAPSPFDLWAQLDPLRPGLLPSTYTGHKKRYGVMELTEIGGKRFLQNTGWQNLHELRDAFARVSYRVTKEECLDLPPVTFEKRYVDMDHAHRAFYEEVRKDGVVLLGKDKQMVSSHAATVIMRAQQICSGFIGLTDLEGKPIGEEHPIPSANKLKYIVEELVPALLEARPGRQVIVWAVHRFAIRQLIDALRQVAVQNIVPRSDQKRGWRFAKGKRKLRVRDLWGDTPDSERDGLGKAFTNHEFDVLVSNPRSGGVALDWLKVADVAIWESRTFNAREREQALGRLERRGQLNLSITNIDVMYEDTVEDYVLDSVEAKVQVDRLLRNKPQQVLREALNL